MERFLHLVCGHVLELALAGRRPRTPQGIIAAHGLARHGLVARKCERRVGGDSELLERTTCTDLRQRGKS